MCGRGHLVYLVCLEAACEHTHKFCEIQSMSKETKNIQDLKYEI